jgi:hypothetical protein
MCHQRGQAFAPRIDEKDYNKRWIVQERTNMETSGSTAERIRKQARALGFEDWSTGNLAVLETDIRASHILKLSKDLREAAERGNHADVVMFARAIVAFIEDKPSEHVRS